MKSNRMLACKCSHSKSIHARVYLKVMPPKLTSLCNFPGCKCPSYRPKKTMSE
jgi:hypothetical protein